MPNSADQATGSPLIDYAYTPMALRILRTAVAGARARRTGVFTETLYFAFMATAFAEIDDSDPEAGVLSLLHATVESTDGATDLYWKQQETYAASGPVPTVQPPDPFDPTQPAPDLSDNVRAILAMAAELAESNDGQIGARHLLGGILVPNVGKDPYAPRRLAEIGIDLAALRDRLTEYVFTNWPDEFPNWKFWQFDLKGAQGAAQKVQKQAPPGVQKAQLKHKFDPDTSQATDTALPTDDGDADPLIDRLLTRRLTVSTMGSSDVDAAARLIDFGSQQAPSWGIGPPIGRGDLVLIYFPKTLAGNPQLADLGDQSFGLRFILRADADSEPAGPDDNFRHHVTFSTPLELSSPVDPYGYATGTPIAEWPIAKARFRRAGLQKEPLPQDLARALWTEILAKNPETRPTLESWVEDRPGTAGPGPAQFGAEVSTHATSDLWTVDDKLDYARYARAIFHFLNDARTEPPLTISIQAPWGGGKTSLMRMIQQQIDPKGYELATGQHQPQRIANAVQAVRSVWSEARGMLMRLFRRAPAPPPDDKAPTTRNALKELDRAADDEPAQGDVALGAGTCASIWFNAWRYQSSDQIWAGLAEAIIRGITDRMEPAERERFLLRLHLNRVDPERIRRKVYDAVFSRFLDILRRVGLWVLCGLLALAGFAAIWLPVTASVSGVIATAFGTALAYWKARIQTEDEPAKLNLSDYVDVPNYSEKLGFVHHVVEDLRKVFALLPRIERDGEMKPAPLTIFIDDLDRCAPQKVAEVFEAINLFVAGEFPNCFIVIGMDTEVVAAALEEAHKDVIKHLPNYARRSPIGWRFMDKFVQLPFVIPPIDMRAVENYAEYLAAAEDSDARKVQARAEERGKSAMETIVFSLEQGSADEEIVARLKEDYLPEDVGAGGKAAIEAERLARREVEKVKNLRKLDQRAAEQNANAQKIRALLIAAKETFSNNPRELKRLANAYRFYYNLRSARISSAEGQENAVEVPTEAQLQNWLIFSLGWPEVVRWLRRSYSQWEDGDGAEADTAGSEPPERGPTDTDVRHRLAQLEAHAIAIVTYRDSSDDHAADKTRAPSCADWAGRLAEEFGLPKEVPWLMDERLFSFIRGVAYGADDQKLSEGAGRGFW